MELLTRQNEKKALEIQATARFLYNKSNNLDMIQWIIVICLPVLKILFSENMIINYILIIWFFLSFFLDMYIEKYTELGSELKKSFDYYVYSWNDNIPEKLIHLSEITMVKKPDYFEQQITNSGTDKIKGVKNWYTTIQKGMSHEKAVKNAMLENIYFDKKINKCASTILILLVVILFLVLSISNLSFYEVIFTLFVTFASLTRKWYSTFCNLKKVERINSTIEELLYDDSIDLYYLQSEIDKKRSVSRTSNYLIYFFQTKKSHQEVRIYKNK